MKKAFCLGTVVLLLLFLLPSPARAQYDTSRFGFKLFGGLNYIGGGDLNAGAKGFSDTWVDILTLLGASVSNEFGAAHLGMNFGGEFVYNFTPNMGVGLGVEYISASTDTTLETTPSISPLVYSWKATPSAIPIKLSFYYFLPSSSSLKIFLNAGLGYYMAKANFEHEFYALILVPTNWVAETSGGGLGFHGGIGLEFGLTPMIGIVAELKGRYASFSNFEGDVDWSFPLTGDPSATIDGKLWATDFTLGGLGTYTWLWIDNAEPAGSNVHEASVDFSGFSFLIGLVIHF